MAEGRASEYVVSGRLLDLLLALCSGGERPTLREVVRCRDCRWYGPKKRLCLFQPIYPHPEHPDHFCALGERGS